MRSLGIPDTSRVLHICPSFHTNNGSFTNSSKMGNESLQFWPLLAAALFPVWQSCNPSHLLCPLPGARSLGVVRQGHFLLVNRHQQRQHTSQKRWQAAPQNRWSAVASHHSSSFISLSRLLGVAADSQHHCLLHSLFLRWEVWREDGSLVESLCCSISALCTVLPQPQGLLADPEHLSIISKEPQPPGWHHLLNCPTVVPSRWAGCVEAANLQELGKWLGRWRKSPKRKRKFKTIFLFFSRQQCLFAAL